MNNYQNQLLERAVIDSDFYDELLANPESFGFEGELPRRVEKQSMFFVEIISDKCTSGGSQSCRCSCTDGFTVKCNSCSF